MSHPPPNSEEVSEKQPWYRNPYVEAYWEMEDVAMDVYEMALTPIVIIGGIIAVYILVMTIGIAFVLLGHLVLLKLIPATGSLRLHVYSQHSLIGTMELSSVGAAVTTLPAILAWNYLPTFSRWGRLGHLTNILLKFFLAVLYGLISGAAGSGIFLRAMPLNSDILPSEAAMVAGALGALIAAPPFVLITSICSSYSRKSYAITATPYLSP